MQNAKRVVRNLVIMLAIMLAFTGLEAQSRTLAATLTFENSKYTVNQGNIIETKVFYNGENVADSWDWYWYGSVQSSDPSVVQVENNGTKLKCVNVGKAVITANYNGITAKCTVNVKANKLTLNKDDVKLYTGETVEFKLKGGKIPQSMSVEAYNLDYSYMWNYSDLFWYSANPFEETVSFTAKKAGEYYINLIRTNEDGTSYSKMAHITVLGCGPEKTSYAVAKGKTIGIALENSELVSAEIKSWTDKDGNYHSNNSSDYYYYYYSDGNTTTYYDSNSWYQEVLLDVQYDSAWTYNYYRQAGVYYCEMVNNSTFESVRIDNVTCENGIMVMRFPDEKPDFSDEDNTGNEGNNTSDDWWNTGNDNGNTDNGSNSGNDDNNTGWNNTGSDNNNTENNTGNNNGNNTSNNNDYPIKLDEKNLKITGKYEGTTTIALTYRTPSGNEVVVDIKVYTTDPKYVPFDKYLWVSDTYYANYTGASNYSVVTVKSSDKQIVEIGENNQILPKAAGSCKLTITIDGIKFTENVKVINVDVNDASMLLSAKKSESRQVKGLPSDLKATYSTSDKSIAKVSKAGKVTAVKLGTATITITIGDRSFSFAVTVGEKLGVDAAKAAGAVVGKAVYSQEKRMQPGYYDCSSLVWRSYKEAGKCLKNDSYAPTAADLGKYLEEKGCAIAKNDILPIEELLPGDLLFSTSGGNNGRYLNIDHVAMYYGASEYSGWWYDEGYYGTIVEAGSGGVRFNSYPGYGYTVIIARPSLLYK